MDRIIPFGYPTIPGGASGGASVDPTPPSSDDPQPGPATPYDLSNLVMVSKGVHDNTDAIANVRVGKTVSSPVYLFQYATLSGIVPVDLTGVKQIKYEGPAYSDENFIFTADGVSIKDKLLGMKMNLTISFKSFVDGDLYMASDSYQVSKDNWNTYAKDKQIVLKYPVHITVYDAAGEIMQEYDSELIA